MFQISSNEGEINQAVVIKVKCMSWKNAPQIPSYLLRISFELLEGKWYALYGNKCLNPDPAVHWQFVFGQIA